MLNVGTKTDGSSTLDASEFNSFMLELENMVTMSGQTLNGAVTQQLANALSIYAAGGASYVDSGTANAYVLAPIGTKVAPIAYFDGMEVAFKIGNTNTGPSTINVNGLGSKNIKYLGGSNPSAGNLPATSVCTLWYNNSLGYFEIKGVTTTSAAASPIFSLGGNLNGKMSVTSASATATFTSDQVIVATSLSGTPYILSSYSQAVNLASTGAGGMDAGSAPVSGYIALYAIYNPTTSTASILATNATSSAAPTIYAGGSMPSGYTASSLLSVWPTNGSSQFIVGYQRGKSISLLSTSALVTTTATAYTSLSISGIVPPNAASIWGVMSCGGSVIDQAYSLEIASNSSALARQFIENNSVPANAVVACNFSNLFLQTSQTIYYTVGAGSGTPNAAITISGYTI